jgi:pimeloyl-ACP methyl ester carboxylesterase
LTTDQRKTLIHVGGVDIELETARAGSPVAAVVRGGGAGARGAFHRRAGRGFRGLHAVPAGLRHIERPDWIRNLDDVAYIFLDLIEKLALKNVPVVGFSVGLAGGRNRDQGRFLHLQTCAGRLLRDQAGGPFDRDVADFWCLPSSEVAKLKWHDPEKGKRDFPSMSEEKLTIVARNVESLARFCWEPFMHNPMLKRRLHRIKVPTRVIWGEHDGIVTPAYGKAYADAIPAPCCR